MTRKDDMKVLTWHDMCRDENEREQAEKPLNYFYFRILLRETGAEAEKPATRAKTGYMGYENGREPENLPECIII